MSEQEKKALINNLEYFIDCAKLEAQSLKPDNNYNKLKKENIIENITIAQRLLNRLKEK